MSICVIGHQRIILTGVLPIGWGCRNWPRFCVRGRGWMHHHVRLGRGLFRKDCGTRGSPVKRGNFIRRRAAQLPSNGRMENYRKSTLQTDCFAGECWFQRLTGKITLMILCKKLLLSVWNTFQSTGTYGIDLSVARIMGVYPISIRTRPKFLMSSIALWSDFVMFFYEIDGAAIHNWLSIIHDFSACDVAKTLNNKSSRGPRADSFLWRESDALGYNSSYFSIPVHGNQEHKHEIKSGHF